MVKQYSLDEIKDVALKFLEDEVFLDKFLARFEDTVSKTRLKELKDKRRQIARKYFRILRYLKKTRQIKLLKWFEEVSDFSEYDEIRKQLKNQLDQTYLKKHLDSSMERSRTAIQNRVCLDNRDLAVKIFKEYPYSQAEDIVEAGLNQNWSMNVLLGDARILLLAYEEAIDHLAMFALVENKRQLIPPKDQGPT